MDVAFAWMDEALSRLGTCTVPGTAADGPGEGAPPEWHALKSRFSAARDTARVLNRVAPRRMRGAFAPETAQLLAGLAAGPLPVNPTDSVNRKRDDARTRPVAGTLGTGGRG